ncbi:MAG: hypothetical protein F6K04_14410 [Leptolyngbya sp. SIO4C5]|nr:hypothetical protein [Leptolyngbya sp. SIO4C5]
MTPKEELIQAIERSPNDLIQALLTLLRVMQQRSFGAVSPAPQKTVLERMGGEPEHMLAIGGLSDRDRRREVISVHLQQKHQHNS